MATTPTYNVGSVIEYVTPTGRERRVKVAYKSPDIKNGFPGFDGNLIEDPDATPAPFLGSVWGFDSQITRVVEL